MLERGHTLGRYRVEEQIGAGGMGEVYRAWDSTLQRWVALKVVAKSSSHAARLLGEARAAAALRHPSIVSVYDAGEDAEHVFVSMDLVEGRPLRDYVGDTSVSYETHVGWLLQIVGALRAAHKAGLVHRDIKPDNVMITTGGEVRVLDFGLAKSFGVDVTGATMAGDAAGPEAFHTAEGRVTGTPAYMAPEQLAGGPPSPSWDQYAWGVLACELLTGKHPRVHGLVSVSGWVEPESMPGIPAPVAQIVARAMAPSPGQRFPSMDAVAEALGAPPSSSAPYAAAVSSPLSQVTSPHTSDAMNVQLADTLEVPAHPNEPKPQRRRRPIAWIAAGASLVAASVVLGWRLGATRSGPAATAEPTSSGSPALSASVVPGAVRASASAASIASAAPVADAGPSHAVVHAAKPRPIAVRLHANPTLQYDGRAIERAVAGVRPLVKSCFEQHRPSKLPVSIAIDLELWTVGDDVGKVRDVRVREPAALARCLHDVFIPLSLGPPRSPNMPPGGVFVLVDVTEGK